MVLGSDPCRDLESLGVSDEHVLQIFMAKLLFKVLFYAIKIINIIKLFTPLPIHKNWFIITNAGKTTIP